jgi:hypothetical protein
MPFLVNNNTGYVWGYIHLYKDETASYLWSRDVVRRLLLGGGRVSVASEIYMKINSTFNITYWRRLKIGKKITVLYFSIVAGFNWGFDVRKCTFTWRPIAEPAKGIFETFQSPIIFASQGLRFGSPFSPPLADLEYILKFACNATWWFIEVAPLR